MRIGDQVTDSKGRSWAIHAQLGRGLWGSTFLVETETGHRAVLKCPLEKSDFNSRSVELADACKQAAHEQGRLLSGGSQPYLPQLYDTLELDSGATALLIPHLGRSLQQVMTEGGSLSLVFQILCKAAAVLTEAKPILHGNLRPTNIFVREDGSVVLTDVLTIGLHDALSGLIEAHISRLNLTPPEANSTPGADWDPWALCMMLYAATASSKETQKGLFEVAPHGLEKVALAALKDRILSRLKLEDANPRFLGRVTDQFSKLLNRGLSKEASPSPPYRFQSIGDFYPRVRAIAELVRPKVEAVGQVLLSSAARDGVFKDGAAPAFSVTVSCSSGTTHEDVATGIRVKDLDASGDSRVAIPGAQYTVKTHPSGRLRFDFTVPALPPGRFQVKVAFTVKESGHSPVLSEGRFEVRPPPGYVPPREEEVSVRVPLQFPTSQAPSSRPMAPDPALDPPSDASDAALFPEPIAPSSPGTDAGVSISNLGPQPIPTSPATTATALPISGEANEPDTVPIPVYPEGPTTTPPINVSNSDWSSAWEELPDASTLPFPKPQKQGSPDEAQDLPTWNAGDKSGKTKNQLNDLANRLGALLWQNNLIAFGVILATLFFLLLVAGFIMNTCAG